MSLYATCPSFGDGGDNGNDDNPKSGGTQPYSVAYTDLNAGAGISGTPWACASFVDNMPTKTNAQTLTQSGWTGQITYGVSGSPKTLQVNNTASANLSPIGIVGNTSVRLFDPDDATGTPLGTTTEPNLDGAFEICAPAPAGSISDNGYAATDILITGSASQVTNVAELAGKSFVFNQYCDPINQAAPQTLTFDSAGNASFELYGLDQFRSADCRAGSRRSVPERHDRHTLWRRATGTDALDGLPLRDRDTDREIRRRGAGLGGRQLHRHVVLSPGGIGVPCSPSRHDTPMRAATALALRAGCRDTPACPAARGRKRAGMPA